eukprot:m.12940 g.12940  ORF g.12940 m.12940 type:complete len:276 (+) comp4756_c0_seq1:190-1017(+)
MSDIQAILDEQHLSVVWLTGYLWFLVIMLGSVVATSKLSSEKDVRVFLHKASVPAKKIARAAKEIERKTFHASGLIVPLWYQIMTTRFQYSQGFCVLFSVCFTSFIWIVEGARLYNPSFQAIFLKSPFGRVMREREKTQLTGTPYFALGCTLSMALFPKEIAITAMLHLVIGDMMAALIGVSFGGEKCVVKLGRDSKKSVEGSLAMFIACFCIGVTVFARVHLCEYVAFVSALVATLTELWSEDHLFGLNDNVSIPVFSCLAMTWAFQRVAESSI